MLFRKIINLMLHNKRNSAKMSISHGGIGEVVNTPDCGSGMRGFDSHISPQKEKSSHHLCDLMINQLKS